MKMVLHHHIKTPSGSLLGFFLLLITLYANGQFAGEKAGNSASILYPGSILEINAGKGTGKIGYNNLNQVWSAADTDGSFFYGGELQGKLDENRVNIFSNDNLSNSAKISVVAGLMAKANYGGAEGIAAVDAASDDLDDAWDQVGAVNDAFATAANTRIPGIIDNNVDKVLLSDQQVQDLKAAVSIFVTNESYEFPKKLTNQPETFITDATGPLTEDQISHAKDLMTLVSQAFVKEGKQTSKVVDDLLNKVVKKYMDKLDSIYREYPQQGVIIYLAGELSGTSFKHLSGNNNEDLNKNINNRTFTGHHLKLGFNSFHGRNILGVSVGPKLTSSLSRMSKKEFTIRSTSFNNDSTQQSITEKKVTAFSGSHKPILIVPFQFEYQRYIKASSKSYMIANPYINWNMFSTEDNILPNNVFTVGLGLFMFKIDGKFLGGISVEIPDVFNENEKIKSKPDLEPFFKRIQLGLTFTYSLKSIYSPNY